MIGTCYCNYRIRKPKIKMKLIKSRDQVRMQNQARGSLYKSSTDCLYKTVSREGVRALFKGMSTPLVTCIPSYALWFLGRDHATSIQQKLLGSQEMR